VHPSIQCTLRTMHKSRSLLHSFLLIHFFIFSYSKTNFYLCHLIMPPKRKISGKQSNNSDEKKHSPYREHIESASAATTSSNNNNGDDSGEPISKMQKTSGWKDINQHLHVYHSGGVVGRSKVFDFLM
jgi:hypothetical protein